MVKLDTQSLPSGIEILYPRNIVNREIRSVKNAGRKSFQDSRKILAHCEGVSLIPDVAVAWNGLNGSVKTAWNNAAEFWSGEKNGYDLFVQDYIYRQQVGLSLPGVPNNTYQTFGLRICRINSSNGVADYIRHFPDVFEVDLEWSFKGVSSDPEVESHFVVFTYWRKLIGDTWDTKTAYNLFLYEDYGWQSKSCTRVTPEAGYCYFGNNFWLTGADGEVFIDNFIVKSAGVEVYRHNFNPRISGIRRTPLEHVPTGWVFYPKNDVNYVDIVYLDS